MRLTEINFLWFWSLLQHVCNFWVVPVNSIVKGISLCSRMIHHETDHHFEEIRWYYRHHPLKKHWLLWTPDSAQHHHCHIQRPQLRQFCRGRKEMCQTSSEETEGLRCYFCLWSLVLTFAPASTNSLVMGTWFICAARNRAGLPSWKASYFLMTQVSKGTFWRLCKGIE